MQKLFTGALALVLMTCQDPATSAECRAVPDHLLDRIPKGVWEPPSLRELGNIGLIEFSRNEVVLGGRRFPLCFLELTKGREHVSILLDSHTPPSDVLVFSIGKGRQRMPYDGSKVLGVSTFAGVQNAGPLQNWVEAFWCADLHSIAEGRFWCSVNDYVCNTGPCLLPR